MILQTQFNDMARYLEASNVIDYGHQRSPEVTSLASAIAAHSKNKIEYVKNVFEYVRDEIAHSADIQGLEVTCAASEVLRAKEGICYAKSHLLAAILRCNQIPAGFCYQKIILNDESAPYLVLHGLNAVYIEGLNKWIRLDARGNKFGIDAQFSLEKEQLAFPVRIEKGEEDIPIIYAVPDENVITALRKNKTLEDLWINLPTELKFVGL